MGIAEIATYLGMRPPNVGKFLERRDVHPYAEIALGRVWLRSDIERVKRDSEADIRRRDADARRKAAARDRPSPPRLGATQQAVLGALRRGATTAKVVDRTGLGEGKVRQALRRLEARGLVAHEDSVWIRANGFSPE